MKTYDIPKFVIKNNSQKGAYTFDEIITPEALEEISFFKTGLKEYEVEFQGGSYNKGRIAILYYKTDIFYISFSPTGKIGRNSFFQSVTTAIILYFEEMKNNKNIKDFSFYFLDFIGNAKTDYHRFMFRIMKTVGVEFLNFGKIFQEDFIPFTSVEDLILSRDKNERKQNNSTYVTKGEFGSAEMYAKTYGASKKESVLIALSLSKISNEVIIYEITEQGLKVLPEPDKNFLLGIGNVKIITTNRKLETREFETNDSLRSPSYIYNLIEKLGPKKCAFCECEIPEIIEGAHIWEVAQIKKRKDLSLEEKLDFALSGNNGIWLCKNHHKMFDSDIIRINSDSTLSMKSNIRDQDKDYIIEQTKTWEIPEPIFNEEFKEFIEYRYSSRISR